MDNVNVRFYYDDAILFILYIYIYILIKKKKNSYV